MLTIISGDLGAGKTLLLTIIGKLSKKKVIANYNVGYKHEKFSLYKFANAEYDDATILIDEAYSILESRTSMSSRNKALSYILFQSRKKSLDMYLTVQLNSTVDVRYRDLADRMIYAYGLIKIKGEVYFKYIMINAKKRQSVAYLPAEKAKMFFKDFDTNQVIEPIEQKEMVKTLKTQKEKMQDIENIAKAIIKKYKSERITKSKVKLYLFENQLPRSYLEYVYVKAKSIKE